MTTQWLKFWNSSDKTTSALDSLFSIPDQKEVMRSISYQLNLRKNSLLAEFGCGQGNILSGFQGHTKKTYGIDFSSRTSSSKRLESTTVLVNDAFNTEVKDELFDRTYCMSLFNFMTLEETIATMKEMLRCTKKDGYVLFGDIIDKKYEKVFDLKVNDINCPKLSSYNRSDLYKIVDSLVSRESIVYDPYDTKIKDYKNNEMTFNILVWKR